MRHSEHKFLHSPTFNDSLSISSRLASFVDISEQFLQSIPYNYAIYWFHLENVNKLLAYVSSLAQEIRIAPIVGRRLNH